MEMKNRVQSINSPSNKKKTLDVHSVIASLCIKMMTKNLCLNKEQSNSLAHLHSGFECGNYN